MGATSTDEIVQLQRPFHKASSLDTSETKFSRSQCYCFMRGISLIFGYLCLDEDGKGKNM